MSSLDSVAAFAADWLAAARPLHLLVNNAGVLVSRMAGLMIAEAGKTACLHGFWQG